MAGTDISKPILRSAAKREKGIAWAVASSFHLPAADGAADILLDCFSPLALEEFRRVLRQGGHFLYVVPGPDHLWELKQVLYDRPYPNEEKETPYEGFAYRSIVPVEGTITLPCQADIHALFQMTPYYWKTPKAGAERLAALEEAVAQGRREVVLPAYPNGDYLWEGDTDKIGSRFYIQEPGDLSISFVPAEEWAGQRGDAGG